MKRVLQWGGVGPLLLPLVLLSALSVGLYAAQGVFAGKWHDWYLVWNLFLAWLPLFFAAALSQVLHTRSWGTWLPLLLTGLWLIFLPNSFYIVTDFIHLGEPYYNDTLLYSAVMFTAFALSGLVLGFTSLALVHREVRRRTSLMFGRSLVLITLLVSSFAIYLGRDLRWNSWDILVNPAGILFDVSDRIVDPGAHPQAFSTTVTFFVFLSVLYFTARQLDRVARGLPKD